MATKYGMAINLDRCVGCGACAFACKTENNTEHQNGGTKYNWADFYTEVIGTFPAVTYKLLPVLCNHCASPACVPVCPVTPVKAIFKTSDGITMINESRCTGCQACQTACPYSSTDVVTDGVEYSVLHHNPSGTPTHNFWNDTTAVIPNGTMTPADVVTAATKIPPYKNNYTHTEYSAVRPTNVVEKCYFCHHRLLVGEQPYCVVSCPSEARIFGDMNDPSSEISILLNAHPFKRLANNSGAFLSTGQTGTDPHVYYVEGLTIDHYDVAEEPKDVPNRLLIYPNPVSNVAHVEFDLEFSSNVSLTIYNIRGKEVRKVVQNEFKFAGNNRIEISAVGLSAGSYICTLRTNNEVLSANFVVSK